MGLILFDLIPTKQCSQKREKQISASWENTRIWVFQRGIHRWQRDVIWSSGTSDETEEESKELNKSRFLNRNFIEESICISDGVMSEALASNLCITAEHVSNHTHFEKLTCVAHHLNLAVEGWSCDGGGRDSLGQMSCLLSGRDAGDESSGAFLSCFHVGNNMSTHQQCYTLLLLLITEPNSL